MINSLIEENQKEMQKLMLNKDDKDFERKIGESKIFIKN